MQGDGKLAQSEGRSVYLSKTLGSGSIELQTKIHVVLSQLPQPWFKQGSRFFFFSRRFQILEVFHNALRIPLDTTEEQITELIEDFGEVEVR